MYNWVVDKEKLELAKSENRSENMLLPFPLATLRLEKNKTVLFNAYADPPTMTAAKVKAIL